MDAGRAGRCGRGENLIGVQVALACRRLANGNGHVGFPHEGRMAVCRRIHGNGAHTQTAGGANNAAGNFTAVGNE